MDITIGIATHKQYELPEDTCYLPIEVGAALHPDRGLGYQSDAEGESISQENHMYSELTALYWLWKNSSSAYKGLVHYRRYLGKCNLVSRFARDRYKRIASAEDFARALTRTAVIVPSKRKYYIETIEGHYGHTLTPEHFRIVRDVLNEVHPDYVDAFEHVMQSRSAHLFNMFVMRADIFDAYCEWLFPILDELIRRVDFRDYTPFEMRFPGRVSEPLLDVWLNKNNIPSLEFPTVSPEPVPWVKKAIGLLKAKFFGARYKASF